MTSDALAIIGTDYRFPDGAGGPEEIWKMLRDGVDEVPELPTDRCDVQAFYRPSRSDRGPDPKLGPRLAPQR